MKTPIRSIQERNLLATANLPLAKSIVSQDKWAVELFGFDHCFSEASLALIRAAERWVGDKGPFAIYAWICMHHALCRIVARRKRFLVNLPYTSELKDNRYKTNNTDDRSWEDFFQPQKIITNHDKIDLRYAIEKLPIRLRKVITLILKGWKQREIAAKYGMTLSTVGDDKRKATRILKKMLKDK